MTQQDLKSIAWFNKIVQNYLQMKKRLTHE